MKILKFLDDHIEEIMLVALLSLMSVIIFVQVFMRYVLKSSLSWSEEIARYMFIWMTYIGISYGVKRNRHIKVDVALLLFPKRARKYVVILSDLIFLGFAGLVVVESLKHSSKIFDLGQSSPAIGLPMGFVYLAPAVGFALLAIRLIQNMIKNVKAAEEGV